MSSPATPPSFDDIQQAAKRIESAIVNTRFEKSVTLSNILCADIWLKFENLQFTSSFKERGALNKLLQLSDEEKKRGVITMSAGNHAKAVAYHAQLLDIPTTVVMPRNTPNVKVEDTRNFGAHIKLHGITLDDSGVYARELTKSENLVLIHPYDDEQIIAGQGTVALEMLAKNPDLQVLVIPIGGGGLIAGNAIAAKTIKPDIKIIGVEVESYASAYQLFHDKPQSLQGSTIAEGIAVKEPGQLTMSIIRELVDDIVLVNEEAIEEAINQLITVEKTVTEGAGAAALAAVASHPSHFSNLQTGVFLCGANIDSRILASVLMRRLVRKGRIVRYQIRITDLPGTLSDITEIIGNAGGNILEVSHQRMFPNVPVKDADLYLTVETRDTQQSEEILQKLRDFGFQTTHS
ncbi:MAG: threonine ammonia-lyase [Gammaproteobacteria bacterium]|nr:threonine ammonia-lyase [Gammaproteobacteria bacterium]